MSVAEEIHSAVRAELRAQKENRHSIWIVVDKTEVLSDHPGQFIYRLTLIEQIRVSPDSTLVLKFPGKEEVSEVQVLLASELTLVVLSPQQLPQQMSMVRVEFDPTFILKKLDVHLDQVLRFPPPPLCVLLSRNIPSPHTENDRNISHALVGLLPGNLNSFQHRSVVRMQSDTIHLLWGPPGTGKTHTVGVSIAEHIRRGKSCLLLSTSNAAVDEIVRASARALGSDAYKRIFRVGATADREIQPFTSVGALERRHPEKWAVARRAEQRLREITDNLQVLLKRDSNGTVFREIQQCKETLRDFFEESKEFTNSFVADSPCVAATLATLVLNETLSEREFDVVYVDEASMVSLPFAFAGAAQASSQVVFAGDFQQLPPICMSDVIVAKEWFGKNVFGYLDVSNKKESDDLPPYVSMLREQYRMSRQIAALVSELSYGGNLITNKGIGAGLRPVFIDVSDFCSSSPYSVSESSYYQPHTLIFLNALRSGFSEWLGPDNLLLTPFRAQRALLEAASKDLSDTHHQFSASTIHRAQGSQEDTVIVDLTAHSVERPQEFFVSEEAENLINVALSRAQRRLIIFGNVKLVQALAMMSSYWRRFWDGVKANCTQVAVRDLLSDVQRHDSIATAWAQGEKAEHHHLPSVYIETGTQPFNDELRRRFSTTTLGMKLVVMADGRVPRTGDGITYRDSRNRNLPNLGLWQGHLALPLMQEWTSFWMPEATKKLSQIACGHLFEARFEVGDTHHLLCPQCSHPLLLRTGFGEVRLRCSREYCGYSRPMTVQDGQVLIEVLDLKCECGARPQPRRQHANGRVFLGCSNYPRCDGIVDLALYADEFVR